MCDRTPGSKLYVCQTGSKLKSGVPQRSIFESIFYNFVYYDLWSNLNIDNLMQYDDETVVLLLEQNVNSLLINPDKTVAMKEKECQFTPGKSDNK